MTIIPLKASTAGNSLFDVVTTFSTTTVGLLSAGQVVTTVLHQNAVAWQQADADRINNERKHRLIVGPQAAMSAAAEDLKLHNSKLVDQEYAACYAKVASLWDTL